MHLLLWKIGIVGILTLQVLGWKTSYDGDQVLQVIPQNTEQVQCLRNLNEYWLLDLWKPLQPEDINVRTVTHVRIQSAVLQPVKKEMLQCSLAFQILIHNVQDVVDVQQENMHARLKRSLSEYNYEQYHTMEEIYHWLQQVEDNYSELVSQHTLGSTYESRPIQYLKISQPSSFPKKIIWMDCGIHAREWIAPAFCQWFVKEIVQNYQKDQQMKKILRNIDLYILPVLNIDGYIYSWTSDRLWRKSRSQHENGTCYGVDLNRNFDAKWCDVGSSKNCSANSFCGNSPASEPETRAVVNFMESRKSDIICYLTIHSYSQFILTAYGYTTELPKSYNETFKVAKMAASALKKKHGTDYSVGTFADLLYEASGTSQDWVHDLGIDYSFTMELRDNGTHMFTLPEEQIQPTCEETMAAVLTIFEYVNDKYFPNNAATTSASFSLSLLLSFLQIV
ncbi:carboxypeptidase O [Bombina bombina]|uniref:carboxypeptidase O n=1 Tax=Bombina bombina TaxID=8345 RepID=UPI00235B2509|nr:carboxypeptidase O [Bombina bombina]XP_053554618.1 carboxypeptidase O [Bombina bombina]